MANMARLPTQMFRALMSHASVNPMTASGRKKYRGPYPTGEISSTVTRASELAMQAPKISPSII